MDIILQRKYHKLMPGSYNVDDRLGNYLVRNDYAKERKQGYETKEEKFMHETKELKSVRRLEKEASQMSDAELQEIVDIDDRKSAVKIAQKELSRR